MKEESKPNSDWSRTVEGTVVITDILTATKDDHALVTNLLIESSFFLPMEVLSNPKYKVSPVVCMTITDFAKFYDVVFNGDVFNDVAGDNASIKVHSDCSHQLLCFGKHIGVSARRDLATNKLYLCFKLWYGKNPWSNNAEGYDDRYEKRLLNLWKFCGLIRY